MHAFHDYFWRDVFFQLELWNQYDVSAYCRTNDAVESWHARFNRSVRVQRPNLFMFIQFLQREERRTSSVIHNARVGVRCRTKPSKCNVISMRIQRLFHVLILQLSPNAGHKEH